MLKGILCEALAKLLSRDKLCHSIEPVELIETKSIKFQAEKNCPQREVLETVGIIIFIF